MATEATLLAEDRGGAGRTGASVLEELMTSRQVATLLQMPASTIEDYARRGVLPSLKLGRHRRYVRSEIERTIAELLQAQPARGRRRVAGRR